MSRALLALTLCIVVAACKDNGPGTASVAGRWTGTYTNINEPGMVYQATLQLTQSGSTVTGTMTATGTATSTGPRAGTVNGTATSSGYNGTFTFSDTCGGTATTAADLREQGQLMVGEYISLDCIGHSTGGYTLTKQ